MNIYKLLTLCIH